MTILILFGSFILLMLLGLPIGIALGSASILTILSLPFLSLEFFTLGLISGLNSFTLLAVILFTLAGNLMSQGGISDRLLKVAYAFFGNTKGGLGTVTIIACLFFAAISGTGSATVAAIGLAMIPAMVKNGYDKPYAGAMVATAGGLGVMIPPSVVMIVYAVTAGVSVTSMFIAGIVPGLVVAAILIIYNLFQSKQFDSKKQHFDTSWGAKLTAINDAKLSLLMPILVLGGIYSGVVTPTESAAVAAVFGFVLSVFVYKELSIKRVPKIILESALLVSSVLIIVGASVAFGRIMALENVPTIIANFVINLTENKILILLSINLLLLIVGTFLETLAAIVILTPILLPVVVQLNVDPVHFGIVMIVNLAIGFVTPPLGANLFMAAQVGNIKYEHLSRAVIPWIIAMLFALMLITFIPTISLLFLS
ncbi:TRAP transporter large permease [Marinomonas sp. 15G1-11]|uniref:TRAP transporter large permease protein n=1 Tax=Marinomonas phaeophyticola TaxID=3004091 RepID=A0ABT4JX01_9GAMM|nr:TRAP transporter large permease [Marinomonas sp. 15G1-11]MCZ2722905.1 TRAP transporter large permease [Marinomonas sp. 15G1-11]